MDIQSSLIAECNRGDQLDLGALLQRLLLFDRCILKSTKLTEVPRLVEKFGLDPVLALLQSGALEFDCNTFAMGETLAKPSSALSFRFLHVRASNQAAETAKDLRTLEQLPTVRKYDGLKLRNAVERRLVPLPPTFGQETLAALKTEFVGNIPAIKRTVLRGVSKIAGVDVRPDDLQLRIFPDSQGSSTDYYVEANLTELGLDEVQSRHVVSRALSGIAEINRRFEEMKTYRAVCGFRETEMDMLEDRLRFFVAATRPDDQLAQLTRVLQIADFPDMGDAANEGRVDLHKLLEVRQLGACVEFRQWLRSIASVSDADLKERIGGMKAQLAAAVNGIGGKVIRIAGATVLGLFNPALGVGASALDSFMLHKVLPRSGPIAFLDDHLPSIFAR